MHRRIKSLSLLLVVATLAVTGCAGKDVVRKEETLVPATSPQKAAATAPKATEKAPQAAQTADSGAVPAQARVADQPASKSGASAPNDAEVQRQLEKVYFDFDSANLSDAARSALSANAAVLSRHPRVKVRVEGNCDELGSDEYNLALGDRRAQAAVRYLQSLGVGAERLASISFGKEKPAEPGHDESARAKNRRDEFVVVSK